MTQKPIQIAVVTNLPERAEMVDHAATPLDWQVVANSGHMQPLGWLSRQKVDVVLIDLDLSHAHQLVTDLLTINSELPIVMLTPAERLVDLQAVLLAGASDFIALPINPEHFAAVIERVVAVPNIVESTISHAEHPQATPASTADTVYHPTAGAELPAVVEEQLHVEMDVSPLSNGTNGHSLQPGLDAGMSFLNDVQPASLGFDEHAPQLSALHGQNPNGHPPHEVQSAATSFLNDPQLGFSPEPEPMATVPEPEPVHLSPAEALSEPEQLQSGRIQSELSQPAIGRPDLGQPELGQSDLGQPALRQPEYLQPETGQPESVQPELGQPKLLQPEPLRQEVPLHTGAPNEAEVEHRMNNSQQNMPIAHVPPVLHSNGVPPVNDFAHAPTPQPLSRRIIAVVGLRGGVGRSTIAVNLAMAIQQREMGGVSLIEAHHSLSHVSLMLHLHPRNTLAGLTEVPSLDIDIVRGHMQSHGSGINVLAAPSHLDELVELSGDQWATILEIMGQISPTVIVDTSSTTDAALLETLVQATDIMVVMTPEIASLRSTTALVNSLYTESEVNAAVHIVLNRAGVSGGLDEGTIRKQLGHELVATLPDDASLATYAMNRGIPFVNSHARSLLTKRLIGLTTSIVGGAPEPTESKLSARSLIPFLGSR